MDFYRYIDCIIVNEVAHQRSFMYNLKNTSWEFPLSLNKLLCLICCPDSLGYRLQIRLAERSKYLKIRSKSIFEMSYRNKLSLIFSFVKRV
jgi:hypothetical protein